MLKTNSYSFWYTADIRNVYDNNPVTTHKQYHKQEKMINKCKIKIIPFYQLRNKMTNIPTPTNNSMWKELTHWGRETHICVGNLTIIGSDNGLSPGRRQAIIGTNVGILLIRTFGTNFSEILSEIHAFWSKKMDLKMSSAKWRPFCLGLNVLTSLVLSLEYSVKNKPMPRLLMPWALLQYKDCLSQVWGFPC